MSTDIAIPDPTTTPTAGARARMRRMRAQRRRRGEQGVALLLVLTSVALLYVLAQQARDEVEVYSIAAAASRDRVLAYYQAKSMVNLSRLLLHAEPTIRRAITPILAPMMALMGGGLSVPQLPIWEQADLLLGMFRNQVSARDFGTAIGVDFGTARGLSSLSGAHAPVIIDEDAKININGFDRSSAVARRVGQQIYGLIANPALDLYFTTRDADSQFTDRVTLISALIDYADGDQMQFDATSLISTSVSGGAQSGPEDGFYSLLRPPYFRKNAPFDSVEELRMVRGMSDDDLWHTVIDPDPGNPHRRTVTVWGQGLVNVNTANAQTILAVICAFAQTAPQCTDITQSAMFMSGLTMIQAFTLSMGIPLFNSAAGFVSTISGQGQLGPMLTALGVQPFTNLGPQLAQSITTESKVFSIYTEAVVGLSHVRIHTVVDMRAQPPIPGLFLQAATTGREAAATTAQVTTAGGGTATVNSEGGTIVYWRED